MINSMRALTIGLVLFSLSLIAPDRAFSASPATAPSPSRHFEHPGDRPLSWDITFLCAELFLGRLPKTMPDSAADTPERITLGKKLYFERGLSANNTQSCHDCHPLTANSAGADTDPTSIGAMGACGNRNAPTVINAGFQAAQFWDGRSPSLVEQAKGPILNPVEMAMRSGEDVVEKLRKAAGYPDAFRRAFPEDADPVTYHNVAEAIASFERTLVAPGRFDRLLGGDRNALTATEKRGLTKFIQFHCVECHTGSTVGGRLYKIIGQRHPYANRNDLGRYKVTGDEKDQYVFKVPMLRNVTRTGPYFHDGQVFTLEEAVAKMGWLQLDRRLTPGDISDLIAFLRTLEGSPPPVRQP